MLFLAADFEGCPAFKIPDTLTVDSWRQKAGH